MKQIRLILSTLFLALCPVVASHAVELPRQGFGIQIGWAQPTIRVNDKDHIDTLNHHLHLNGAKVGLVYDASYIAGFGSTMGINYTFGIYNGGWNQRYTSLVYPQERHLITYNELELFVDWQYKFEVAKETYLILYTGPTIQCGLTLNWRKDSRDEQIDPKTGLPAGDVITTRGESLNAYDADGDNAIKRLNITWGVGAGFQYKRYFLRGGYDFGLINPHKYSDFSTGIHTRGRFDQWSIKIGMYLWYVD